MPASTHKHPRVPLLGEPSAEFMQGALEEVARQHGLRRPKPRRRYRKPVGEPRPDLSLFDRIEHSATFDSPLYIDWLDLLRLQDDFLPLWLGDAPAIVAGDEFVGQYIRDAFRDAEDLAPPIFLEVKHD